MRAPACANDARSVDLRAQGESCAVDDSGVVRTPEALLWPHAALIALPPWWELRAKYEMVTIATREIRNPAISPEEHDTAPNRIWIWPVETAAKRKRHLNPGPRVTGRHELPGYEPALRLVARPVPGGHTFSEAGPMSFV